MRSPFELPLSPRLPDDEAIHAPVVPPIDHDVTTLNTVAPGVVGLRVLLANVFALQTAQSWALVDTGPPGMATWIAAWAEDRLGGPPFAIFLTHAHFDHAGSLSRLLERWDVPVYIHSREIAYVTGQRSYPPPDAAVGGGLLSHLAPLYPRTVRCAGDHLLELPDDGSLPGLAKWRWIETPGHTAGHVSFFRAVDRVLVVGDAFATIKAESLWGTLTQHPRLSGPPAYFTTDWDAASASVSRLAALEPTAVAPSHGPPISGRAIAAALTAFADQFDSVARPLRGRYVLDPVPG
jgi:glyoxylase-like metal-dependent hydrolase (beta-lactamase superfamily II)